MSDQKRRVLLVEDDQEMATSLAILLEAEGYHVKMVPDGETALETAAVFHPDVCLVDVNVPRLSGCNLTRHLRELLENQAQLANVTPFHERDDCGDDDQFDLDFTKPSDPYQIVDQLKAFLRNDPPKMRSKFHSVQKGKLRMPESRVGVLSVNS